MAKEMSEEELRALEEKLIKEGKVKRPDHDSGARHARDAKTYGK